MYPADQTGCGFYRLIWPGLALKAMGHDVEIIDPKNMEMQFHASMKGDKMIDVKYPADADVMVLQRTTHKYLVQAIALLRQKGVTVVIDMDDDLTRIDPRNPAWTQLHPREGVGQPEHAWTYATDACRIASYVTVSTPALMKVYAPHERGEVIPNFIPRFFTDVTVTEPRQLIGWGGSAHSHPGDLQVMGPTLQRLIRAGNDVAIVGGPDGLLEVLGQSVFDKVYVTGISPFHEWSKAIARLMVGLAPLADTQFNRAKSWLKPLEYAAVGAVPVASPRAEYRRLNMDHGIGYLAEKPSDWFRISNRLMKDFLERYEKSQRDREYVRDHLTIEDNAWRWAEAWETARKIDT